MDCPNHIRRTKSSIKKRIIVRRSVRSMFGEQTFTQLRTGLRLQQPQEPCCTHSYQYMQYFRVPKHSYGCQGLGFLTYAQMLMHEIVHGGSTDLVRESVRKMDSGRRKNKIIIIPCSTGDSNPRQYCAWLFSPTLYPLSYIPRLDAESTAMVMSRK